MGAKRACGEGAVDLQHGTGVEGSLYPCTKATNPSKNLFVFYFDGHIQYVLIIRCICWKSVFAVFIFFCSVG